MQTRTEKHGYSIFLRNKFKGVIVETHRLGCLFLLDPVSSTRSAQLDVVLRTWIDECPFSGCAYLQKNGKFIPSKEQTA